MPSIMGCCLIAEKPLPQRRGYVATFGLATCSSAMCIVGYHDRVGYQVRMSLDDRGLPAPPVPYRP